MKKLLLLLLISFGFLGSAYAAKNAGLALAYGFGSVSIAVAIGFVLFILIKPKKDTEKKKAVYYGRLFLAYILWIQTAAIFPQFLIYQDINTFMAWLAGMIAFGFIAYIIGFIYGGSKKTVVKLAKDAKTITKTAIEKSEKKPIKKPVGYFAGVPIHKTQELTTEKNITKNENTMDEENSNEINDEEFYLIATNEVERGDINPALWAKFMAINMGDEKKSKYDYVNKRVAILVKEAEEARRIEAEVGEEKRIAEEARRIEAEVGEEKRIAEEEALNYFIDGIKFNSKKDFETYTGALEKAISLGTPDAKAALKKKIEDAIKAAKQKRIEREATQEKRITKEAKNYSIDGIKFKSKSDFKAYIDSHPQ